MTDTKSSAWEALLIEREVDLPSPPLTQGLAFLERTRTSQGWGAFPGLEFDRHASAVAMDAVFSTPHRQDTSSLLLPTSLHFAKKYDSHIQELGVDALVDVISLLHGSLDSASSARETLIARAHDVIAELLRTVPPDTPRRLASVVLGLETIIKVDLAERDRACNFLLSTQNQSDGSWSTISSHAGSLTATAEVLRALSLFDGDDARKACTFALRFVEGEIRTILDRQHEADTFDLAVGLRALATFPDVSYEMISSVESEILARQDSVDGGWPSARGRDSSVELTGLAVIALVEAGAHSHVPLRLARSIMTSAARELAKLDGGAGHATQRYDLESEKRRLELELQRTRDLVPELERELRQMRRFANPLLYERELITLRLSDRLRTGLVSLGATVTVVGCLLTAATIFNFTSKELALYVLALVLILTGVAAVFAQRLSARRAVHILHSSTSRSFEQVNPTPHRSDDNIETLRRGLQTIVGDWTPSARAELAYLLYDMFLDVPSDVAARRAERVAIDLGVPQESGADFSAWASAVGLLTDGERRVLFDQIRRVFS